MAKPVWVKIVHPVTGGKTEVQESVFAGEGGLRDRGWILEADLPKRSPKKPAKVKEQTDE